jgi:predicted DsbA family dithiol-disulfide isomerase
MRHGRNYRRVHGVGNTVAVPVIEVFADISCPFAYVGLHRLVERRDAAGRPEPRLLVRAWPLELVNGAPQDPQQVARQVAALRAQVAPELFRGFDSDAFPGTLLPALGLAARAYRRDAVTGERVSLALRAALFEQGLDVADPKVLAQVAQEHELDPVGSPADELAVLADWQEGQQRGVIGSPHFFLADGNFFCPSMTIERADGQLVITADPAAFDRFIAQSLD